MATYLLKAADEDMQRWRAAARDEGAKFAVFVRDALDLKTRMTSLPVHTTAVVPIPLAQAIDAEQLPKRKLRKRTEGCIHRVPPGSFCKRCD